MTLTKDQAIQEIAQKWQALKDKGFDAGGPKSDIQQIEDGWYREFEHANIYAHHEHGTHEVHGVILAKYLEKGGPGKIGNNPSSFLGFPVGDETNVSFALAESRFSKGIIFWIKELGAVPLYWKYYQIWKQHQINGRPTLGLPVTDVVQSPPIIEEVRPPGQMVLFQWGAVVLYDGMEEPAVIRLNAPFYEKTHISDTTKQDDIGVQLAYYDTDFEGFGGETQVKRIWEGRLFLREVGETTGGLAVDFLNVPKATIDPPDGDIRFPGTFLLSGEEIQASSGPTSLNTSVPNPTPQGPFGPTGPANPPGPQKKLIRLKGRAAWPLKDRQLYGLGFHLDQNKDYVFHKHAVYAKSSWENFGFIHATDLHLSKRIDGFWNRLKAELKRRLIDKDDITEAEAEAKAVENANKLNNYNDNFRDLVRYANFLHAQGKLDFILATGDIVDYQYEIDGRIFNEKYLDGTGNFVEYPTIDGPVSYWNFDLYEELVYGKSPYSDQVTDGRGHEELKVPIFSTYGNHDYRKLPYELLFEVHHPAPGGPLSFDFHKEFGLDKEDAKAIQQENLFRFRFESKRAQDILVPVPLSKEGTYVVNLGKHKIVLIDTKSDIGVSTSIWNAIANKLGNASEDVSAVFSGNPNSIGFEYGVVEKFESLLKGADKDGLIIVGLHAPPLNHKGKEYSHYFRETEHRLTDEMEIFKFVERDNTIILPDNYPHSYDQYVKEKYAGWFTGNADYFKKGSTLDLLDAGVSRGDVQKFLELCVNRDGNFNKKADLVLFGHVHRHVEYRIEWWDGNGQEEEMRYYMDFYTHNPSEYYQSIKYKFDKALNVKIDQSVSIADPEREKGAIYVPPYAKPLNESNDPEKWWDDHRPLLIQSAPLGPKDDFFHGCRLIYVEDDVISRIHPVKISTLRKAEYNDEDDMPPGLAPQPEPADPENPVDPNSPAGPVSPPDADGPADPDTPDDPDSSGDPSPSGSLQDWLSKILDWIKRVIEFFKQFNQ